MYKYHMLISSHLFVNNSKKNSKARGTNYIHQSKEIYERIHKSNEKKDEGTRRYLIRELGLETDRSCRPDANKLFSAFGLSLIID